MSELTQAVKLAEELTTILNRSSNLVTDAATLRTGAPMLANLIARIKPLRIDVSFAEKVLRRIKDPAWNIEQQKEYQQKQLDRRPKV